MNWYSRGRERQTFSFTYGFQAATFIFTFQPELLPLPPYHQHLGFHGKVPNQPQ